MFNKKIVSVRIDEDTLKIIDLWCNVQKYANRSQLINHVVSQVAKQALQKDGKPIDTHRSIWKLKVDAKFM